jgi:hypothetical protein
MTFNQRVFLLAAFVCAVVANALEDSSPACGYQCRFIFCPAQGPVTLGKPDVSLTNPICDKHGKIHVGHVDSTGEAYVDEDHGYKTLISKFSPPGLTQNFSPSFWKSFDFNYHYNGKTHDLSGVGHETPQQNQASFLLGKCFILPLTAYQVLDKPYGNVIDNKHPTDPFVDCVAFTVN